MVRDCARDLIPRQPMPWQQQQDLPQSLLLKDEASIPADQDHRRPMEIAQALREHCHIPVKRVFVSAILDDGRTATFTNEIPVSILDRFFNERAFSIEMDSLDIGHSNAYAEETTTQDHRFFDTPSYHAPDYGRRRPQRRHTDGLDPFEDDVLPKVPRKRTKSHHPRGGLREEDEIPVRSTPKRGIKIKNSQEVWNFYDSRFKMCQQTACKLIAKAWVKAVAPKKQTNHPYTRGEDTAPDWWPKPSESGDKVMVRHKEPDHLYKKERVHLLIHLLRMVVEPNRTQHADIQKLHLNVDKLEDITLEALSVFFTSPEVPGNAKKKPVINEIFRMAKMEQRYKNGEIDGEMEVFVMADDKDKTGDGWASDNENSTPTRITNDPNASSRVSPSASVPAGPGAHPMMQSRSAVDHHNHHPSTHHPQHSSPVGPLQSGPFMNDLAVRGPQYPPDMVHSDLSAGAPAAPSFDGSGGMMMNSHPVHTTSLPIGDMLSNSHEANRRPSIFTSSAEYNSPVAGPHGIYGSSWHHQPTTTAPGHQSMYTYATHQQPSQHQTGFIGHGPSDSTAVTMPPGQSFVFDGLPSGPDYDQGPGPMFRGVQAPGYGSSYNMPSHTRGIQPVRSATGGQGPVKSENTSPVSGPPLMMN